MLRKLPRVDDVANCLWAKMITGQVSDDLQWKTGGRKNDNRPGVSKFVNILAVFGGRCQGVRHLYQECQNYHSIYNLSLLALALIPIGSLLIRVSVLGGLKPSKMGIDTHFGKFLKWDQKNLQNGGFLSPKWEVST